MSDGAIQAGQPTERWRGMDGLFVDVLSRQLLKCRNGR